MKTTIGETFSAPRPPAVNAATASRLEALPAPISLTADQARQVAAAAAKPAVPTTTTGLGLVS